MAQDPETIQDLPQFGKRSASQTLAAALNNNDPISSRPMIASAFTFGGLTKHIRDAASEIGRAASMTSTRGRSPTARAESTPPGYAGQNTATPFTTFPLAAPRAQAADAQPSTLSPSGVSTGFEPNADGVVRRPALGITSVVRRLYRQRPCP
jgi:hypothetical protein